MTIAPFRTDATALLGRDPCALADDFAEFAKHQIPEVDRLLTIEMSAVEKVLLEQAAHLVPTAARTMAIEILPVIAMLCDGAEALGPLVEVVRDWIAAMGDPVAHARTIVQRRQAGDPCHEAELTLLMARNAVATFDIHDDRHIVAILEVRRRDPQVVGVVVLDDGDADEGVQKVPDLVS